MDETIYLVQLVQSQDEWTKETTQEIMFSFLCNISQADVKDLYKINILISQLITDFRTFSEIEEVLKIECTKSVFKLRSRVFKHSCAKRVHDILEKRNSTENGYEADFKIELETEFKIIEQQFEESCNVCKIGKYGESFGSIDSEFFNLSLLPSSEELVIKELVKQYLPYMLIINDKHLSASSFQYSRHILKGFHILKLAKTSNPEMYIKIKNGMKRNLFRTFEGRLREDGDYFDIACKVYIEDENYQKEENENEIMKITEKINILRKIQDTFKIYEIDFIRILEYAFKEGKEFNFDKHFLLRNYKITKDKQSELQITLKEFGKAESFEWTLDKTKIILNTNDILYNIMATFSSFHNIYKIKFGYMYDAFFNSEVFLFHFLCLEKKYWETNFAEKQNFGNYLLTVFEQVLDVKFDVSFVTDFIIDEGLVNTLDKESQSKLAIGLIEASSIATLVELLNASKEENGLYDILLSKLPETNLDDLRQLFSSLKHAKILFKHLAKLVKESGDCERIIKLEEDVLQLIHNIVYNLYCREDLGTALELVDVCINNVTESKKLVFLHVKRLKARIYIRQGELLKIRNLRSESESKFEAALKICFELKTVMEEIQNNSFEHNAMFLIILSSIGFVYYDWDKNSEAHETWTDVYNCIKNYVLYNLSAYFVSRRPDVDKAEDFFDIIKSEKYFDLCQYTKDASGLLDLVAIRTLMASRLIRIRWKEHNYSVVPKELKLYSETLVMFKGLYKMLKLKELLYYKCDIGNITWRTGYMHINLYRVKSVINSCDYRKEIVRHTVEALRLNNLRVCLLDKENHYSPTGLETIFLTLHDLAKTPYFSSEESNVMMRRLNDIREPMIETLGIKAYVPYYRNLPSET